MNDFSISKNLLDKYPNASSAFAKFNNADEIELENSEPFIIDVNANGQYFIEEDGSNVQVSLGFIEDRFAKVVQINPDIEIIVRGDQNTSYQSIAELLSTLQANGANNFSLATQP